MAEIIKMPKMSDTMTEGVIISWLKKVGDQIKSGDILAEVETDKATMELESYDDGTLLYIGAKEKDKVPVGNILAIIGEKGENYKSLLNDNKGETNPEEDTKVDDSSISLNDDKIEKIDEPSEKNNVEESSQNINGDIDKEQTNDTDDSENIDNIQKRIKISPLAKKIATDMGYDISNIKGTGDNGRIIRKDLDNLKQTQPENTLTDNQNLFNDSSYEESFDDISISSMRNTIGKKLNESLATAPHFYITSDINMSLVVKMRESLNKNIKNNTISFNDIILKAVSIAIRRFSEINVAWLGDKIRKNKHIHIGVAVAINDGLVVPVVKFADTKTLTQISLEVKDLVNKSKEKKLGLDEMKGSTFCISNLGMFGVDSFTSIINPPSACILAIGGIHKKPVVDKNDEIIVADMMKVTLSSDHRVIDGAIGAKFLCVLKSILEEPITMLL